MSREWKSGEVAVSMGDRLIRTKEGTWSSENGQSGIRYTVDPPRPLVVIDPEDREQVERLAKCYREVHGEAEFTDEPWSVPGLRMQAALREFVDPKPPKPEEPTAMWSVVVDADDEHWVRALGPDFTDGWVRAGALPSNGKWTDYADIDAVKVLRDGIPV